MYQNSDKIHPDKDVHEFFINQLYEHRNSPKTVDNLKWVRDSRVGDYLMFVQKLCITISALSVTKDLKESLAFTDIDNRYIVVVCNRNTLRSKTNVTFRIIAKGANMNLPCSDMRKLDGSDYRCMPQMRCASRHTT